MGYEVVNTGFSKLGVIQSQYAHSKRRKILAIAESYLRFELGMTEAIQTAEQLERIESELLLRQVLKSTDIVKGANWDYATECLILYVTNPDLPVVPANTHPPTEIVS